MNDVAQCNTESTGRSRSPPWEPQKEALKARVSPDSSPRLVGGTDFDPDAHLDANQIAALAKASLRGIDESRKVMLNWHRQGQSFADIYINGIAPAARLLGTQWTADSVDFVDLTIAVSHLQTLMHEFSAAFLAEDGAEPNGLSLLVMTEPNAQHTLGSFMLGEFFRRAGWTVTLGTPQDMVDFERTFQSDWFDAVMLSIASDRSIDAIATALPQLLANAINPELRTYVGGPMATLNPEKLKWRGTTCLTVDAEQAVDIVTKHTKKSVPQSHV